MSTSPIVVHLDTADPVAIDHAFGAARHALLTGRASLLAVEIGPRGMNRHVEDALNRWMLRNAATLRSQLEAIVYVVPSWWAAIVIRVDLRAAPPPVPYAVLRSLAAGVSWAAGRRSAPQSARAERPEG